MTGLEFSHHETLKKVNSALLSENLDQMDTILTALDPDIFKKRPEFRIELRLLKFVNLCKLKRTVEAVEFAREHLLDEDLLGDEFVGERIKVRGFG